MNSFSDELAWSLAPGNTSAAVTFLRAVWPAAQWITTVATSDQAGIDLLGTRPGKPPIRIDAKFRRVTVERRSYFDRTDPDTIFDLDYSDSGGGHRFGPVRRYGPYARPPCDAYLFTYPDEQPPLGLLVAARPTHEWLYDSYQGLKLYKSSTVREDGLRWETRFVAVPGSVLNALAGRETCRLLTLNESGSVWVSFP